MKKKLKIAKDLIAIAKQVMEVEQKDSRDIPNEAEQENANDINNYDIDKVIIKIVPWGNRTAMGTINVMQGGKPHFSLARIKNLLDRNRPNFEYDGKTLAEIAKLKQDVIDCFGSEQQLIDKLKNLEQTGVFYAQVDNFEPFCDAYHLTNEQGIEIYVKFTIVQIQRRKADFVIIVRCHPDTIHP